MKTIGKVNGENGYPGHPARSTESEMQTQDDLVELARACLKQARESKNPVVVAELTHLAKGYQMRAASMDNGRLPDIGEQAAVKGTHRKRRQEAIHRLPSAMLAVRSAENSCGR
jgi:hypothetical protein